MVMAQASVPHKEKFFVLQNGEVYLQGRVLVAARVTWSVFFLINMLLVLLNLLMPLFGGKIIICPLTFTCPPSDETLQTLKTLHISPATYDAYVLIFGLLCGLIFVGLGVLLFWRKSTHLVGLLASFAFIFLGFAGLNPNLDALPAPFLPLLGSFGIIQQCCQSLTLGFFLVTFPDGRFAPRWSWLVGCSLFFQALLFIIPGPLNILNWHIFPLITELVLAYSSPILLLIYRYVRVFSPAQRKQTRWVAFGLLFALPLLFLGFFAEILFPQPYSPLLSGSLSELAFLLIPISVAIGILRSRLWDIDVIINRTLVYGSLTALLALVYFSLIFSFQSLTQGLTGQAGANPLGIVGSTLATAALFQPLRGRIQTLIDRRFYRQKYDAARTLQAFSATLHQEVDLAHLSERIVDVVQETVQPSQISLWLFRSKTNSRDS
jgi:hypothetical protein